MDSGRLFFDPSCYGNMVLIGNGDPVFSGARSLLNMEETSKRRHFFSSPNELFDEEYYDEQLPEKKRRLTPEQIDLLEKSFETENKLGPEHKTQLAKKLGLQPRQVAVWFQNRRARWKTKQLERDYDLLKSSYDSLLSDYESIIKENQMLISEVISLTEKLQAKEVSGVAVMVAHKTDAVLPVNEADVLAVQVSAKAEDHLSSGSAGSAVVDDGPQLVDSGDSYFLDSDYRGCMSHIEGIHLEEEDGSDDCRCYFPDAFAAAEQQFHEEEESLDWWVWS
ncbi:hypothetical protein HHK36_007072 [Tetracentron sinense]|uniref:Homeobox-leucine zipper protein n=1 Tax=Tetracentron sinense TaxID=13715 RepID=A0A834ZSV1_TETSI|nr:hypothetical protein HHK36_007072 [Tetracentron sinense]